MHGDNLIHSPQFLSLEQFSKDIARIAELFSNILDFRLLGGEPFLNPDLPQFTELSRKTFPNADIRVTTNALLLFKQDEGIWENFRQNRIGIHISEYPPNQALLPKIKELLEAKKIPYQIVGHTKFTKRLTLSDNNPIYENIQKCDITNCATLRNGKIYKCAVSAWTPRINAFCNHFYDNSKSQIDIYGEGITGIDILKKLAEPIDFCKYCKFPASITEWTNKGKPCLEDWVNL
jgi:MoaA/NifB/PqqE/SkfB family radical SAM enzyme